MVMRFGLGFSRSVTVSFTFLFVETELFLLFFKAE